MSISQDDIIQTQTGSFNANGGTATLPSGTTDGNTVVVCVMVAGSASPTMTGFTRPHGATAGAMRPYILVKSAVTAGETSWAISAFGSSLPCAWVAMEIQGLSKLNPYETWANPQASMMTGVTSVASATTLNPSYSYEYLAFAFHGGQNTAAAVAPTFTGHTGGFTEISSVTRTDGATGTGVSVSLLTGLDVGSAQCTATASVSINANAVVLLLNAENARRVPNVDLMSGAEHGTAAGRATGITGGPPVDSSNGSVSVVTTSPRSGTYCWELTGSGAAANFAFTSTGAMSHYTAPGGYTAHRQYVTRFSFYMPTLPGADVTVAAIDNGTGLSGAGCQLVYRTASQSLGLQVAETGANVGTEVLAASTVTAATWHSVDLYLDMTNRNREGRYHGYWQIDGVAQTEAFVNTGTSTAVSTFTQLRFGWTTSSTATLRIDDIVGSKHPGHFPIGSVRVYPLTVDTGAAATVTTAANFSTFTNNGTLNGTFNTTTARDAVDELPPTIGGTADGFVQDTAGASDYVAVAMTTRNAGTNLQSLRAIRWYFCGWANAAGPTTAATIGFRGYDGTDETVLFAAAEPNFQNSTAAPAWICRMQRTLASNVPPTLTQARLDGLTARVGFSGDASPVVGVHAIIAEVAMRDAEQLQVIEVDDGVLVYALLDPDTGNVVAMRLVAPADGAAWARYTVSGVDVDRSALAGGEDLYVIGAETNQTVSFWTAGRS